MTKKKTIGLLVVAGVILVWITGRALQGWSEARMGGAEVSLAPYRADMDLRAVFETFPLGGDDTQLRLLNDNVEAWTARWRMLRGARKTLDVNYFILRQDVFGAAFLGHLISRARAGCQIRVLLDAQGTKLSNDLRGNDYLDTLVANGIEVKFYRPVVNRVFQALFTMNALAAMASDHDKIIVADGGSGIVGGRNIAVEYFAHHRDLPKAFQDTDLFVGGPRVAKALVTAFESQYASKAAETVLGEVVDIDDASADLLLAYRAMDAWLKDKPLAASVRKQLKERNLPWRDELAALPRLKGALKRPKPEAFRGETRVLDSHVRLQAAIDPIGEGLVRLVRASTRRVVVQSPYLVLSEDAVAVLEEAGRRGVAITILTNSPVSSDNAMSQAFFLEQWPEMLARVPKLRIFVGGEQHNFHSKVATFDNQVALVGTYNLDPLSMAINSEIAATVWSQSFAAKVSGDIEQMIARGVPKIYEYKIRRDARGQAQRDADGRAIIAFGPKDHADDDAWKAVERYWKVVRAAESLPGFPPLF